MPKGFHSIFIFFMEKQLTTQMKILQGTFYNKFFVR